MFPSKWNKVLPSYYHIAVTGKMLWVFNIPSITEFGSNELYKQKFQLDNNFILERHNAKWGCLFYGEKPELKPESLLQWSRVAA